MRRSGDAGRRPARRAARAHGLVYVEALILVLFFFVVWTSLVYVTRLHVARQGARLAARECAWKIASAGCEHVPAACAPATPQHLPREARLEEEFRPVEGEVTSGVPHDPHGLGTSVRDLVATEVSGLLFRRIVARAHGVTRQTPPYGGGTIRVEATYALPCNARPSSVGEHARRFFDALFD